MVLKARERMSFNSFNARKTVRLALLASVLALGACQDNDKFSNARATAPIPADTLALMETKGTTKSAPMLIRTFKKEAEFEVWKMKADGRYALLKTFPMCRWSGQLGPKTREGDRQVPEGFYNISPAQMNPNSNYYLSFNVGYPNAYDRSLGRGGGLIMVHGACSSAGCFSMTDQQIAEIYALARESFSGGQKTIQMESLPFRMTAENLAKHRLDPNINFWNQLKEGSDNFDVSRIEPKVGVCNRHYVFNAQAANSGQSLDAGSICPPLKEDEEIHQGVVAKQEKDRKDVAELVAKGVKPVKVLYADGGQHPDFARLMADVSRPEALAAGPVEIALGEAAVKKPPVVQMASVRAEAESAAASPPPARAVAAKPGVALANAPVLAAPEVTSVAATAPAAEPDPASPFYKRWLGLAPAETAKVDIREPAVPELSDVPLPPRRQATAPAVKPQAALQRIKGGSPLLATRSFAGEAAKPE